MNQTYFCYEQLHPMQSSYDAFVMVKIASDSGCDVQNDPIEFHCNEWGTQVPVFYECLSKIFGEIKSVHNGEDVNYQEESILRIPLPELNEFFTLVSAEEGEQYIQKFKEKMNHICDYFEMEMKGEVIDHSLQITLSGYHGVYYYFLKKLVEIKNEVLDVICERKAKLVQNIRNEVMLKMVHDRLGKTIDVSLNNQTSVVFSQIMNNCNFEITQENSSDEDMMNILREHLEDSHVRITTEEDAA